MPEGLDKQMAECSSRNTDLHRLMLMCKTEAQVIYVVCVGAGDAFINRYWPILRMRAALGSLKLLVADEEPLRELVQSKVSDAKASGEQLAASRLEQRYKEFVDDAANSPNVRFVNVKDEKDRRWYDHIRADVVFALVPDEVHIRVAKQWLKRATLVLVEKPYNRRLEEAVEFEHDMRFMMNHIGGDVPATWVCSFDHYLSKIHEYVFNRDKHQLFNRIGRLTKVEFAILEAGPLELWRAGSLQAGMIYDLFSHVLAMLSIELDLSTFGHGLVRNIRVAKHKPSLQEREFPGDTFASFDFRLRDRQGVLVDVLGVVGKGVGSKDEKYLTLVGESGKITCDLDPSGTRQICIEEASSGKAASPIYQVGLGHEEFLQTLLSGRYAEQPIGGLSGVTAIEVLRIMNRIREGIPATIYTYDVGTPRDQIAGQATGITLQ